MENSLESVEKPVKRKLRWYQFSLRSLLIVVTLFAIACSWFAVKMGQAKRQREAIEALNKMGVIEEYDYLVNSSVNCQPNANPPIPLPLRKVLGDDFFMNVTKATITSDSTMTDADLERLIVFGKLKWLNVSQKTPITGAGLKKLQKGLPDLEIRRYGLPE